MSQTAASIGAGFTGSYVGGVYNFQAADRSILGNAAGATGVIPYSKMVWGGSGEVKFVNNDPNAPSAIPVNLATAENQWLYNLITSMNGVVTGANGITAINITGVGFSGNIIVDLSKGVTLSGVSGNFNVGVTFGAIPGYTSGGYFMVGNYQNGAGQITPLTVTGGVQIAGGTVNVSGFNGIVNFPTAGITVIGMAVDDSVFVTFEGLTIGLVGTTFGTVGATFGGVTFGTVGVTFGTVGVTFGGVTFGTVGATFGTVGVTFGGVTFGTVGVTWAGSVSVSPVTISGTPGVTFGRVIANLATGATVGVVFTDNSGVGLGLNASGQIVGLPVFGVSGATALRVEIVGGLSGITVSGFAFPSEFGISGGTVSVANIVGTTFGSVQISGTPGVTIAGRLTVGIDQTGTNNSVMVRNSSISDAIPIKPTSWVAIDNVKLKDHLSGLTVSAAVSISGLTFTSASSLPTTSLLGVSFGNVGFATPVPVNLVGSSTVLPVSVVGGGLDHTTANALGVTLIGIAGTTGVRGGTAERGLVVAEKPGTNFAIGMTLSNLFFGFTSDVTNIAGVCATNSYLYLKTTPVCVTTNYSGPAANGTIDGQVSVPLKQGLYVQLTKWDLISHVHVGYTASTVQEFRRNAQVLHKEYQMAPVWAHALDQFRRFPGVTGNNGPVKDNDFAGGYDITNSDAVQKQFVGIIEKPTRIFVPCRDAGEVYVLVNGDYAQHEMGAGFWDQETKTWTPFTLYERSYYASSFYGFTGGEPALGVNGEPTFTSTATGVYTDGNVSVNPPPPGFTSPPGNPGTAIAQILAGYTNNPFIRIWGY